MKQDSAIFLVLAGVVIWVLTRRGDSADSAPVVSGRSSVAPGVVRESVGSIGPAPVVVAPGGGIVFDSNNGGTLPPPPSLSGGTTPVPDPAPSPVVVGKSSGPELCSAIIARDGDIGIIGSIGADGKAIGCIDEFGNLIF